jgi:transcriptional regulator with XRE-family HTH domain
MLELFGNRLKDERIRLGFNQEDFAILGGVSKNTQLGYEQGTRPPDVSYLFKIADHGADLFYLLARAKEWDQLGPTITALLIAFKALPPNQQALALGVMTLFSGTTVAEPANVEVLWLQRLMRKPFWKTY